MQRPGRQSDRPRSSRAPARAGVTVFEVILVLPILVILLLAMVEFGMILANLKQVGMASRIGSERASQTAGLPTAGPVPADIVLTVQQQLQTAGMTPSRIVLQHNTDSMSMTQYTLITDIGSGSTNTPSTTAPLPATEKYVRLTVFVPLTELTANMLATFGFDISTREVEHTTTFRYEQ